MGAFVRLVGGWVSNIAEPLPQSVQGILFFYIFGSSKSASCLKAGAGEV